ncbi:amino acid aminotransferase [Bacillus sp. HMF5848]|uniref:aminotransferase class IV n=1 Tax=Bacillus sp. HMF5848 TaxID=2495421 RepID=UPI000F77CF43|nr:aminotransferase class IV [Bacillus sp. HMF5848]RSK26051.1 amino acid aminotransferase [Bacillus sp. HMF5848]
MEIAFFNGEFVDINQAVIPIQERAHQFGDGIYEVIRVYEGRPFYLKEHLERLVNSAEAISLKLPYSLSEMDQFIEEGLTRASIDEAEIYIQVTRGIAPRIHAFPNVSASFSMTIRPVRKIDPIKRQQGIAVLITEDERWKNCYIKSLNLLPNVLAKQKAIELDCDEAIFVRSGYITEGSSSNVFIVKNGALITTPATNAILHGITRAIVFQLANQLDIPVHERAFTVHELETADEAFITSTVSEILKIKSVGNSHLPSSSPIQDSLYQAFQSLYKR